MHEQQRIAARLDNAQEGAWTLEVRTNGQADNKALVLVIWFRDLDSRTMKVILGQFRVHEGPFHDIQSVAASSTPDEFRVEDKFRPYESRSPSSRSGDTPNSLGASRARGDREVSSIL